MVDLTILEGINYNTAMQFYLKELFELLIFLIKVAALTFAIYFILKRVITWIHNSRIQTNSMNVDDDTKGLKLQAYERLSLYIQRISIPQILYRLKTKDMSAADLQTALLVSIQKEFEHNNTQQIYVSDKLWQIISLAKDETAHMVTQAFELIGSDGSADQLIDKIIELLSQRKINPNLQAASALKKEVELILR